MLHTQTVDFLQEDDNLELSQDVRTIDDERDPLPPTQEFGYSAFIGTAK